VSPPPGEAAASRRTGRFQPGWWVLSVVLAALGVVLQLRALGEVRRSVRSQWAADGGREPYHREPASR
jgi:hypothetical protein